MLIVEVSLIRKQSVKVISEKEENIWGIRCG